MNLLVTAGNSQVLIDRVRCVTNIFTGRTGAAISLEAYRRGHNVTLVTSHPETLGELPEGMKRGDRWRQLGYRTFDELQQMMEQQLRDSGADAVIHSAAVSDYLAAGIFAPAPGSRFAAGQNIWQADTEKPPAMVDRAAGKIKSDAAELWLRLVRAPKLVDMIRTDWGFHGTLVKFKLEVGLGDEQLLEIAEKSRLHSQADLMVANTLEGAPSWAFIGSLATGYARVARHELAAKLMDAVENDQH